MKGAVSAVSSTRPRSIDSLLFLGADSSESKVNFLLYYMRLKPKKGLLLLVPGMIMLWLTLSSSGGGGSWRRGTYWADSSLKAVVTLRAILSSFPKVARLADEVFVAIMDWLAMARGNDYDVWFVEASGLRAKGSKGAEGKGVLRLNSLWVGENMEEELMGLNLGW